mmetsp:Transcript_13128/g.12966  ORF Transcript_13128/g.12966 Transcript_13128/m.12966 type:complete len:83 (-) Transcript_13128:293-541(-)
MPPLNLAFDKDFGVERFIMGACEDLVVGRGESIQWVPDDHQRLLSQILGCLGLLLWKVCLDHPTLLSYEALPKEAHVFEILD